MSPEQIQELKRRTESDPNDEIAHFSLGKALVESGDAPAVAEGAKALQRVIALNPNIAKAYQLLGDAQIKTGFRDYAIQTLTEGGGATGGEIDAVLRLERWLRLRRQRLDHPTRKEVNTDEVLHA